MVQIFLGRKVVALMEVFMVVYGLARAANEFILGWRYC